MKNLTRAEEQVMKVLWNLGQGLLMEIVENMPEPKAHKNTVATILKTLVEKQFVHIEALGRINRYHPSITKEDYSNSTLTSMVKGYFEGSFSKVVSFLVEENKLSIHEIEFLLEELKKKEP
jgi:predicted transcriptional regulator